MDCVEILERRIKDLSQKYNLCIEQQETFNCNLGTPEINKDYKLMNDFMLKRQEDASFCEYEIKILQRELNNINESIKRGFYGLN